MNLADYPLRTLEYVLGHDTDGLVGKATPGGGGTPGGSSGQIQFNNGGAFGGFGNWDGTGTLALKNGTNPQEIRIYSTDDGAGNSQFLSIKSIDGVVFIATDATGTGSFDAFQFYIGDTTARATLQTQRFTVDA